MATKYRAAAFACVCVCVHVYVCACVVCLSVCVCVLACVVWLCVRLLRRDAGASRFLQTMVSAAGGCNLRVCFECNLLRRNSASDFSRARS